jgi:hypothetical protein
MAMSKAMIIGVSLGLLVAGTVAVGMHIRSSQADSYHCLAGQNEVCPTEEYVFAYHQWVALRDKVQHEQQSAAMRSVQQDQDQFSGMTQRLQNAFPPGMQFDEKKLMFIPKPAPLSPNPVAAPTQPTPAPAKE